MGALCSLSATKQTRTTPNQNKSYNNPHRLTDQPTKTGSKLPRWRATRWRPWPLREPTGCPPPHPSELRERPSSNRDAHDIINARQRKYVEDAARDIDDSDYFPAFSENITNCKYPKDFKPDSMPKFDGKQDP